MRAPSSTAWPTKRLISQEEMWGNLSAWPTKRLISQEEMWGNLRIRFIFRPHLGKNRSQIHLGIIPRFLLRMMGLPTI